MADPRNVSGPRHVAIPDPFPEPPAVNSATDGTDDERPENAACDIMSPVEEQLADLRRSSIEAGRRKGGIAGAALAGSMLALRDIYEGPPKELLPIEIEASGQPHDVDRDGIAITVDGLAVHAPALSDLPPSSRPDPTA